MISNIQNTPQTFTGFYKIKGTAHDLKPLVEPIRDALPDSFVFFKDKSKWKRTLYILTGKHKDKIIDKFGRVDIMDLKENVEKYLAEKAVKLKFEKIKKAIEDDKLTKKTLR